MIRTTVVVFAAVAALASGALARGDAGGVVASATGSSHFTLHNVFGLQTLKLKTFSFEAKQFTDGFVRGRYLYKDLEDGVPNDFQGPITCLVVKENHAWLGGTIEKSSDPTAVGQEMWFQVIDNGEGPKDPPDITTLIGMSTVPGSAQSYCDRAPQPRFPWPVEHGNIEVRD